MVCQVLTIKKWYTLIFAASLLLLGFCFADSALAAAAVWTTGKYGSAYDFNGSGYISCGSVSDSVRTISFWLEADNTTQKIFVLNSTDYLEIVSGVITPTGAGWSSPTIYVDGKVSSTVDTNWHHIAIINSSAINGSAVYLGFVGVGASYYFDGILDDIRIYNYARTADEIRLDYQEGLALRFGDDGNLASLMNQGLVGYWSMNEGTGTTAYDGSGNGNNGTLTNGPQWTTGKVGGALQFDGVDDYVEVPNSTGLNPSDTITIEAWVKGDSFSPNAHNTVVFKSISIGSNGYGITVRNSYPRIYVSTGTTEQAVSLEAVKHRAMVSLVRNLR